MVESIQSVNGATYTTATSAVSKVEKTDEIGNNNDQVAKTGQTSQVQKTEEQEQTQQTVFTRDDLTLRIKNYVESLKVNHPGEEIAARLDLFLSVHSVDEFMKDYPVITSESDLSSILHQELAYLIY